MHVQKAATSYLVNVIVLDKDTYSVIDEVTVIFVIKNSVVRKLSGSSLWNSLSHPHKTLEAIKVLSAFLFYVRLYCRL